MPTEQEAKPAVVTPSLQQWRSPSTFRGAPGEDPLKWLKEYDRVANFNKWDNMMCLANVYFFLDGTARQWYVNNEDALDSSEAFKNGLSGLFGDRQKYTRRAEEQLKCRAQRSGESTQSYIQSVLGLCQEIVQDEVERVLAPVSTKPTETRPRPTYAAVTRKYRAPVQKFPPEPRKTDVWRTADNRPVCFHCGRPGHVMRYCRERKAVFELSKPPTELRRHPRRHIADPVSRQAVGARKTKESDLPRSHDVILGWDFLEASQAVIDCGQNELVLEDICRDSTAPDAWNLYATRDYTLKPHSLTRITVSGYQTRGDINVVLDGSKHLLFEKILLHRPWYPHIVTEKVMSGLPTCSSETKSSLEECA
ncbi:CCHC-type domain-containing protein [Trichonephila clavipes]|nr:CCHC-type domain-containing protein [Trichonephila clavipes]